MIALAWIGAALATSVYINGVRADVLPEVTLANAVAGRDRPLRVLVSLGGQVRMCDPAKILSAAAPEGCPPPPVSP